MYDEKIYSQFQCDLTEQEGKLEASKLSVEKCNKDLEPIEVHVLKFSLCR